MKLLRLDEILKEKRITGKKLAEKVNVTPNTISRIITGASFPSGELLKNIADALNVSVRDLFAPGENEKDLYIKQQDIFIKIGEIKPF